MVGPADPCTLVVQGFFAIEPQCKIHNLQNLKGHRKFHHRRTNDSLRGITSWWFTMSPCNFELVILGRCSRFMPRFFTLGKGNRNRIWIQITLVIGYNEVYIQAGYSTLQSVTSMLPWGQACSRGTTCLLKLFQDCGAQQVSDHFWIFCFTKISGVIQLSVWGGSNHANFFRDFPYIIVHCLCWEYNDPCFSYLLAAHLSFFFLGNLPNNKARSLYLTPSTQAYPPPAYPPRPADWTVQRERHRWVQ